MEPISKQLTSTRSISEPNSYTFNLEKRLEENRPFLDNLKQHRPFQNIFTLMHNSLDYLKQNKPAENFRTFGHNKDPEELIFKCLTGQAPLNYCFPISLFRYHGFSAERLIQEILKDEIRVQEMVEYVDGEPFQYNCYFLDQTWTDRLSAIFSHGWFEPADKTQSKMITFMEAIENGNSSGKLHLSGFDLSRVRFGNFAGADCRGANFVHNKPGKQRRIKLNLTDADCRGAHFGLLTLHQVTLTGANLLGAQSSDPNISAMIKEQELFEKYKLSRYITAQHNLYFPEELFERIGSELKEVYAVTAQSPD